MASMDVVLDEAIDHVGSDRLLVHRGSTEVQTVGIRGAFRLRGFCVLLCCHDGPVVRGPRSRHRDGSNVA